MTLNDEIELYLAYYRWRVAVLRWEQYMDAMNAKPPETPKPFPRCQNGHILDTTAGTCSICDRAKPK